MSEQRRQAKPGEDETVRAGSGWFHDQTRPKSPAALKKESLEITWRCPCCKHHGTFRMALPVPLEEFFRQLRKAQSRQGCLANSCDLIGAVALRSEEM